MKYKIWGGESQNRWRGGICLRKLTAHSLYAEEDYEERKYLIRKTFTYQRKRAIAQ